MKKTLEQLKAELNSNAVLGNQLESLTYTRNKKNPYLAVSKDGLNQAFGKTKEQALENLINGIAARNG